MTNIPGFLTKTFEIFSNPNFTSQCGWGVNGDTIVIFKIAEFASEVLPQYFKHSNFQSFVRQLNMYNFHKTVQDPTHGEFQHQYFRKGRPDLLHLIKRKAGGHSSSSSAAGGSTGVAGSSGGSGGGAGAGKG
ncbi:HSF-type DNA-binding-domain-containing protein, partial [Tribonema minus]